MSYYDAVMRATEKANARARKQERDAKRAKLFECDLLECFEFDESEIFEISEAQARYAIAH